MARGNTVELVFAGDDQQLQKTFANVGQGADKMAGDVGSASKRMADDSNLANSKIGEGIDGSERKFRGLGDIVGGTGDVMEGFKTGNVQSLAMGFADLAGGMSDFVIPAIQGMRTAILTGLAPALTAISAHPLIAGILIGGAIIAGLILLEKKFGLVSTALGFVKDAAGAVLEAIGGIVRGFRDLWNSTVGGRGFTFGGIDLPGPLDVPGFSLRIPTLHTGGMVPGVAGQNVPAILQAGEMVTARGQGAGNTIVVNVSGVGMGRDFGDAVARALRDNRLIGVTI
jgi:hypothetical protein